MLGVDIFEWRRNREDLVTSFKLINGFDSTELIKELIIIIRTDRIGPEAFSS